MHTAVIILEYNNANDTINCLRSLQQYNTAPIKVIVVDNGSSNINVVKELDSFMKTLGNYERIDEFSNFSKQLPDFALLVSATNDGYAAGNNKGLQLAYNDSEISTIMILNSDVLFFMDIIPKLLLDLHEIKDSAIFSPLLYKKDREGLDRNCARRAFSLKDIALTEFFLQFDPFKRRVQQKISVEPNIGIVPIELPSGSCMLFRKEMFQRIGGFDPVTFLYYEENILWEKIKVIGLRNYLDTDVGCIHLGATSTKCQASEFLVSENAKSQYYFADKYLHAPRFFKWALRMAMSVNICKVKILNKLKS